MCYFRQLDKTIKYINIYYFGYSYAQSIEITNT